MVWQSFDGTGLALANRRHCVCAVVQPLGADEEWAYVALEKIQILSMVHFFTKILLSAGEFALLAADFFFAG